MRALSPLTLLAAVCALQFGAYYGGAGAAAREAHVATSAPLPPAAPASDAIGFDRVDGDAGTGTPSFAAPCAAPARSESSSAVVLGFCPWLPADALARAGRSTAPATAPPVSRV